MMSDGWHEANGCMREEGPPVSHPAQTFFPSKQKPHDPLCEEGRERGGEGERRGRRLHPLASTRTHTHTRARTHTHTHTQLHTTNHVDFGQQLVSLNIGFGRLE